MYACIPEMSGGFLEGVCTSSDATAHLRDPLRPPLNSRIDSCESQRGRTGQRTYYLPRSPDQELRLGRKLIDVVVVSVVYAVDVA